MLIKWLCFFKFGTRTYQQTLGFPMGSDPALLWLTCSSITIRMSGFEKQKEKPLQQLENLLMFSALLATLNDGGELEKASHKIY